jgi:hypothetical protein
MITLVRATRTSWACPSQWDAWDAEGNYYYLRFRYGTGQMRQYKSADWVGAPWIESADRTPGWGLRANSQYIALIAEFTDGDEWAGVIELDEFARLAGIELAPDIMITGYGDHVLDELTYMGVLEMLPQGNEEE